MDMSHNQPRRNLVRRNGPRRTTTARDRGVASILAMMFLILFGSLAAAMAIASRGNIRTAATHVHVMRAQGAAETGLAIAQARLLEAAQRFVISRSNIDSALATQIWNGNTSGAGTVQVLPPLSSYPESALPGGIAAALANRHAADQNIISGAGVSQPTLGNAMADVDLAIYQQTGWLYTPVVGVDATPVGGTTPTLGFTITYAPLVDGRMIRAIVTGFDFAYTRNGQPLSRTIMQDFALSKVVRQAIVAPTKILVGKNVQVQGDLGARFTQVEQDKGEPLKMNSDFFGLDPILDQKLRDFFAGVAQYDADGDNRLRVNHPLESMGIPPNSRDYESSGRPSNAFVDVFDNGFIDDYSIFVKHFDRNADARLVLSTALTDGTPAEGTTAEFTADENLALLIDAASPDRNRNGVSGYTDTNNNGRWDDGEDIADSDDVTLGWRDGALDARDRYAKVSGRLLFATSQSAWSTNRGPIAEDVQGAIVPGPGKAAQTFNAGSNVLPAISASSFDSTPLKNLATGATFAEQVATNLGIGTTQLATYVETKPSTSTQPRFLRVDPDTNNDGRPDNFTTAYWERMPLGSPNATDIYYRPVYQNMTFRNVVIPAGNNGLFVNCTFIGVTLVQTHLDNTHPLWSSYGQMRMQGDGFPGPYPPRTVYGDSAGETSYPTMLPTTAIPTQAMILMANPPLDKADIPANQVALTTGYSALPDPLVIGGRRIIDTKTLSNNIRFHDSLIVGSIVSDSPAVFTNVRNKVQFTGKTRFTNTHPTEPSNPNLNPSATALVEINKSSMMLPNYSVDVGNFNAPPEQDVRLQGAVIAGLMDLRGNVTVDGALLLTFDPQRGTRPLVDVGGNPVGNPADFNVSLGYFGINDGDQESLDPNSLPVVNGQRIVGWDLNNDGIADLGPTQTPTQAQLDAGATAVPFHGFGRISLRLNPNMVLPDGIMLPLSFTPQPLTYREGKP